KHFERLKNFALFKSMLESSEMQRSFFWLFLHCDFITLFYHLHEQKVALSAALLLVHKHTPSTLPKKRRHRGTSSLEEVTMKEQAEKAPLHFTAL
ncbi:MAG: hypothetical protein AAGM67_09460, partial [Bacteroidota bacterium]